EAVARGEVDADCPFFLRHATSNRLGFVCCGHGESPPRCRRDRPGNFPHSDAGNPPAATGSALANMAQVARWFNLPGTIDRGTLVAFRGLPPTRHMEDTTMVAVFKNESIEIERAVHAALEGRGELEGSRVDVDMA